MLFPLDLNTPQCEVFKVLNNELLYFLEASIQANAFDENLFSQYQHDGQQKRSVCWSNKPTKEKFEALWLVLKPLDQQARRELFELVRDSQDIAAYFDSTAIPLPELDEALFDAFKSLTSHLFTETKERKSSKEQANSSIQQHFQDFKRANGNSQLCFLCGTSFLSQDRVNLTDDKQWRADYDHVLCKDKYPIYTTHPGNFIPTCHICNSKAKGAKNVLYDARNRRREAFYPLPPSQESCYQYAQVEPKFRGLAELHGGDWQDPIASASITFPNAPGAISEKIDVWKEVYQVPSRVEEHVITHFCERIASDLMPQDFNDFSRQLARHAGQQPLDIRKAEWRFWWFCVYEFLVNKDQIYLRDVWSLIEWKQALSSEVDMQAEFGI
ncbi:hypothetical protein [Vibrio parahaemolyticus]|uniref:hypothetical protein n=1 Tax=Vibrio parahaemolyticus TaxID=670 RepID=UPI00111CD081|nr:hypothetical protein [Vibrio parahaemolyticus]TOO92132.1 hypothetical protein CGH25_22325 [Vibrio parahaemolyticus]TOO98429.1 hypothetical protein CGH24_20030 [Vibrio parahaemolyticus]TOQ68384.1 hypothetical protein CGG89_20490 [Vibrio parahaemolyticus]